MRLTSTIRIILMATIAASSLMVQQVRAQGFTALVIGDSLSAAYGIREDQGWVALAEQELQERGYDIEFVNASISGDTTVGGLRRLPDALERFSPDLLIIELGGNDGLRGYSTNAMQKNIEDMARLALEQDAQVLILGMLIPSNYGQAYLNKFAQAFVDAAENTDSALVPFFLEPIAHDRKYFQADGIHPTAQAQPLMLDHVMQPILDILESAAVEP